MSQSLSNILIHIVFSTAKRRPWLKSEFDSRLTAYFGRTLNQMNCPLIAVGVAPDHVHLLVRQHRTISVSDIVRKLKVGSSKMLKMGCGGLSDFAWQKGYGSFSIGISSQKSAVDYIQQQRAKHESTEYKDEYLRLCQRYQVPFDPEYMWD